MASHKKIDISSLLSPTAERHPTGSVDATPFSHPSASQHLHHHHHYHHHAPHSHLKVVPRQGHRKDDHNFAAQATTTNHANNHPPSQPLTGNPATPLFAAQYRIQPSSHPPAHDRRPSYGPYSPQASSRNGSISMDTLADLASLQQYHRSARHNSVGSLRSAETLSHQTSPSIASARPHHDSILNNSILDDAVPPGALTPASLIRKGSIVGELPLGDALAMLSDLKAVDVPSLSQPELDRVQELTKDLGDDSYSQRAHIELVQLLHRGLLLHVLPTDGSADPQDPQQYALLSELRKSREAMHIRFAVNQDDWLDCLHDEAMLAQSAEECLAVVELCKKATQEAVGSSKIWRFFGDWMGYLFGKANDVPSSYDSTVTNNPHINVVISKLQWTEEDKLIGKEVFTWNTMLDIWQQGISATEWHLDESHNVWNAHMSLLLHDIQTTCTPNRIQHLKQLYIDRLCTPHLEWDETSMKFSEFVGKYDANNYESIMSQLNSKAKQAKSQIALRQSREDALKRAIRNGDTTQIRESFSEYLEWETEQGRHNKRKNGVPYCTQLLTGLLERANLRLPQEAGFWQDHLDAAVEGNRSQPDIQEIIVRATRYVPWSGDLWAARLGALEAANRPFEELEDVKHLATSTGLLENDSLGSMDDLIKVYLAWCGFLRRRAFASNAGEDERDMAEVGIQSSIENIMNIGNKKYGKEFKGDPYFRIEQIFFKFYSQMGAEDQARRLWDRLSLNHGDQFSFWDKYYQWEMVMWGQAVGRSESDRNTSPPLPSMATAVLQKAIRRHDKLEYAEQMIEMYLHHCAQHETIQKLKEAQTETRVISKKVARRRAREAETLAAQQQQYEAQYAAAAPQDQRDTVMEDVDESAQDRAANKRKRDQEPKRENKRRKSSTDEGKPNGIHDLVGRTADDATLKIKRDREHTVVVVTQLPSAANESDIRSFFEQCGLIKSVNLVRDDASQTCTASIEFESAEDASLAQAKHGEEFEGQKIEVSIGTSTTLYVTNYPPKANKAALREMFTKFGDIVEMRFPNLDVNSSRRFCYIQMLTTEQAQRALELDGYKFDEEHIMQVRISDPTRKKQREGSQYDGRELFIMNLNWSATDKDVKKLFEEFGRIANVRVPTRPNGGKQGIAYVAFETKEQAEAALIKHGQQFMHRELKVMIADPNHHASKRPAAPTGASLAPEVNGSLKTSFRAAPVTSRPRPKIGGRSGLGFKASKIATSSNDSADVADGAKHAPQVNGTAARSQNDFRAMLLQGKKQDDF